MVINQLNFLFSNNYKTRKNSQHLMNHESNKSTSFGDKQSIRESQSHFCNIDWNSLYKEQPIILPSTQSFFPYYQQFMPNFPFISQAIRYPSYDYRLPPQHYSYLPLSLSYRPQYRDFSAGFQKAVSNTRASIDEQGKRQTIHPKIQQQDIEEIYIAVKQQPKIEEIQQNKSHFNVQKEGISSLKRIGKIDGQTQLDETVSRKQRVVRYLIKKQKRKYEKRIVYQCRKSVADNRQRFKGRFVKRVLNTQNNQNEKLSQQEINISI